MAGIEQGPKVSFPRSRLWPTRLASLAFWVAAIPLAAVPCRAQAILPAKGVVSSGAASIQQSGANLSVTQTSPRAIINWGSFSIGPGNGVTFDQPNASSAILNRVTGSTTSTIAGQLTANGQVYLVNPNGIAITPTGSVRVGGGFVASTLGIADSDFNGGNLRFSGAGASAGVANAGSIEAAPGGFVGLIGGTVSNSGVVSVPLGKVAMGSGEQATLNLTGDNFLQVAVPTNTKTADGKALIDVSGKVLAAGGSVQLKAATVAQAIRNAVNVPGELNVSSARASGGAIILSGGPRGNVTVTGRLDASGATKGGSIAIDGHNVALRHAKVAASSAKGRGGSVSVTGTNAVSLASAAVDASGATGGGAIRIGGDFHGASGLTSAQTTTIDSASTLNASATGSGNGGTVAVWSDTTTSFGGQITATGGASGGNGGYVEVSANPATHGVLDFAGSADLTAPKGTTGTILLDPYDITISTGSDFGGSFSGGVYAPSATPSNINNLTLDKLLGGSNVVISTGTDPLVPGAGNVSVSGEVLWSSGTSLTLQAANDISIGAPITATGAGSVITLIAGGDITERVIFDVATGSITGPTLSATSSAGRVVLTLFNDVASVSGSAPLGFSFLNTGALDVGSAGITSNAGSIALATIDGSITQTGPLRALALFAQTGLDGTGDVILNNPNNSVGTLAGSAIGNFQFANNNGADLVIGPVNYFVSTDAGIPVLSTGAGVFATGSGAPGPMIQISNVGNLVVDSAVTSPSPAGLIVLAATGSFINNVGPGAIVDPWQIYSASPAGDVFNGLDSGNAAVWNTTFGEPVTATGNRYIFAFQPAITVAAGDLVKLYGQDVTALVAADYTISGLQPGVPGAFLGDTAAAVFSGAPTVISAGSPASAPSVAFPYPIIVGLGSLVIGDGYGFVANNGRLFVLPPPFDPGFLPGLTQINNPAGGGYDLGAFGGLLQDFSSCEEPPTLPDPNRYADPDAALRAISHALDAYFKRCQNPTQETIAAALEEYAAKLQVLAPRLPPALRNVPTIIAEAARRVRAARSRAEAVAVLRQTVAAVHKEISLVLSEDPETRSREIRDGDVIAGALGSVTVALVNSGGL